MAEGLSRRGKNVEVAAGLATVSIGRQEHGFGIQNRLRKLRAEYGGYIQRIGSSADEFSKLGVIAV
ncbi:hypothetical protein C484_12171 [Natrialba taiwanensis DSM 12281]|uniref:Uncharacterized protein n=1 Tax=Natrialba taiwanensis DSM 12281 TaxID=1230458 RepID=L9ZWV0_9EURY|nr:hypothetical protein C484_12171 [Natrialba taiwanensis DSM 12281]